MTSPNLQTTKKRGPSFRSFPPETLREIIALYESGLSQHALAVKFGTHQTVVSRLLRVANVPTRAREHQLGARNPHWKGGRSVTNEGYVLVMTTEFPEMRGSHGYIREHRLVMARSLGRALKPHETVHHKNGDKADNRLENLELRVGRHGNGATHAHCSTCTCFGTED